MKKSPKSTQPLGRIHAQALVAKIRKTLEDSRIAATKKKTLRTRPHSNSLSFELGVIIATPAILSQLETASIGLLLDAHSRGHWGPSPVTSHAENARNAKKNTGRISSSHQAPAGKGRHVRSLKTVWIITEGGRGDPPRRTTILFPDEY